MTGDRLRVIVNDRCLRKARTGVGHYVAELLAELPSVDPGLDVLPFYQTYLGGGRKPSRKEPHERSRPLDPDVSPIDRHQGPTARRTSDRLRRMMQGCYELAFEAVGELKGYRLYHEPNHIPGPWQGPIITTIHDLSVLRHPEWHPVDRVRWYEREFEPGLARSEHFIAVSEFTRQEMIEQLHIGAERISTIHLGIRSVFRPRSREEVQGWLTQRCLATDYLLFVGTIEPRKNVDGLLTAYARLPAMDRHHHPLFLAGIGGWGESPLQALIDRHGLADCVRPLGYVADEDLAWLYAGAKALVWPTLYEGFGLPVLESMACGTPVIASRAASLPEVVGEAGLLVDPRDAAALAAAMQRVIEDTSLARRLAQSGLERSGQFSWRECAARHAYLYRRYGSA